jgi:hypothetical protein
MEIRDVLDNTLCAIPYKCLNKVAYQQYHISLEEEKHILELIKSNQRNTPEELLYHSDC